MIRVEQVFNISELAHYEVEWKLLISRMTGASVFDTYEWVTTWLDCFWKDKPICCLFFWKESLLIGILLLLEDQAGVSWCTGSLVSASFWESNRANIICSEDPEAVFEALLDYLYKKRPRFHLAFLQTLAQGPVAQALPEIAKRNRAYTVLFHALPSPIIRITSDWEMYLNSRSRHFAREMRRKVKHFENAGRIQRLTVSNVDQCDQAMQDILCIDKNSWKEEAGSSLHAKPRQAWLYGTFASRAAENGWLRLYLQYLDSKPVAYLYGIVFQNQFYAFKTSYDKAFRQLTPGIVLFDYAFRNIFKQRLEMIDLLGIESRWKNEFANDFKKQVNVCCRMYQKNVKPFIKKTLPFVVSLKKKL
jgi:hypothetical protein